ncbi:hypothetical protein AK830_g10703 [Neonectria ditissima]|uniref:DUF829 domain-containing protein n=1 Tax=Neonectria ditissima TaxID=78410 RepID=A0A0N8H5D5_9HYPO|nr:hypothetical protein AK830_g10703 [Neonectria ditissima]
MGKKLPSIPGFVAVSDQILVQDNKDESQRPLDHPQVILIFGWGDCLPKHVAKYSEGYRELFPHSTQIVILAPIAKVFFTDLQQRSDQMTPVLKALDALTSAADGETPTILAHAMSDTGGTNYASTLNAFRLRHNEPLPHQLLVLDSTPGSPFMTWQNLKRWSRAMTLGTAAYFPWPFVVTQAIWGLTLLLSICAWWLTGREPPAVFSIRAIDDATFETKSARRLYLYSQEDDLIPWEDIESYRAQATEKGYETDAEMFEGTGHVGHMRMFPDKYWGAIQTSWRRAIQETTETR